MNTCLKAALVPPGALSEVERALHAELATMHGQMAAKYRALSRAQTQRPSEEERP